MRERGNKGMRNDPYLSCSVTLGQKGTLFWERQFSGTKRVSHQKNTFRKGTHVFLGNPCLVEEGSLNKKNMFGKKYSLVGQN